MKRADLVLHLLRHWCYCRPDGSYSVFLNPATRSVVLVPPRPEIPEPLGRELCRILGVPEVS
jgi:hypothetical protein